jgi:hypothetical protein
MKRLLLILSIILLVACNQQRTQSDTNPSTNFNEELRIELLEILTLDQDLRIALDTLENMYDWDSETVQNTWKQIHHNDSVNLIRVESIIEEHGWPTKDLVGEELVDVPFLVLQHCGDVEKMEKYLPLIKEAVEREDLEKQSFALFIDRIKMFKGNKQIYGTQLSYNNETGELELYPVEDETNLDQRREEMGLGTIEAYMKHFGLEYKKPE